MARMGEKMGKNRLKNREKKVKYLTKITINIFKELESDDLTILVDECLAKYSTMRVGGVARIVALPKSFAAFLRVFEVVRNQKFPYYILGNGSNTLCSSSGFDGVVICTKFMNKISKNVIAYSPARQMKKRRFNVKSVVTVVISTEVGDAVAAEVESARRHKCKCWLGRICYCETTTKPAVKTSLVKRGCAILDDKNALFEEKNIKNQIIPKCGILKNAKLTMFAECGALLPLMSKCVCDLGYSGFEFACGIPASCGGAVKMNAGAFGGQMADIVSRVLIFNTKTCSVYYKNNEKFIKKNDFLRKNCKKNAKGVPNINFLQNEFAQTNNCEFCLTNNFCEFYKTEYRKKNREDCEFIIGAEFIFPRGNKSEIIKKCLGNTNARRATQSVGYPSLGSVFKRNGDFIPSAFIDKLGLKGLTLGGAQVSKVHAGYIVNCGGATSDDILKLLKFLQNYICKISNIVVQYELKFLGEHNEEE